MQVNCLPNSVIKMRRFNGQICDGSDVNYPIGSCNASSFQMSGTLYVSTSVY